MTRLIAVRHGHAEGDELTPKGIMTQKKMCEGLPAVDQIYSSPLTRAQQTAQILSEALGGKVVVEVALDSATFDEETLLTKIVPGKTTLFVGHDPTIAMLVNNLVGEAVLPTGMAKSGAAIIDFSGEIAWGAGELVAYRYPR